MKLFAKKCVFIGLCFLLITSAVNAQGTAFTFQGQLQNAGNPASGSYDFEFLLFDAASGGTQIGTTAALNGVTVANGIFSVNLDFGDQFPGASRFLEIKVRQSGGGAFTTLNPRQKINSAPYGVKALNADNALNATNANNAANAVTANNALSLGGVAANQYVLTGDARLSDARTPLPNSPNYIQNTTSQQSSSNFNISGNGTVGGTLSGRTVNAAAQYNLNGNRILSIAPFFNLFVGNNTGSGGVSNSFFGSSAGRDNTLGNNNSFFGASSGSSNTKGFDNSFFGAFSGNSNNAGVGNSFFGTNSGFSNTDGGNNSFFGLGSGYKTTIGLSNSFFGRNSGFENTIGSSNSFFGDSTGYGTTVGIENTFIGVSAGQRNTTGSNNTLIGTDADVGSANLINANAFGSKALVTQSNSLVLGSINGVNGADADTRVGIGTTAPAHKFHLSGTGLVRTRINSDVNSGISLALNEQSKWSLATVGGGQFQIYNDALSQNAFWINPTNNNIGIGTTAPTEKFHIAVNGGNILFGDAGCNTGFTGLGFGAALDDCGDYSVMGNGADTMINRPTGGRLFFRENNGNQLTIAAGGNVGINTITPNDRLEVNGIIRVSTLGAAGSTNLCRNASNQISTCSSSMRYKSNVNNFTPGLNLIKRLRPVSFNWKADNETDLGLVAEEVAEVEPLLVTKNEKGETEGVKYDRVGVVLVNAVQEQQTEIESLEKQLNEQNKLIEKQQSEIEILKSKLSGFEQLKQLVCLQNRSAQICQPQDDK